MLILSRKCGESIMIGDEVEVHVLDIRDGKVRLGVLGPAWMPVHQRERCEVSYRTGRGRKTAETERVLTESPQAVPVV